MFRAEHFEIRRCRLGGLRGAPQLDNDNRGVVNNRAVRLEGDCAAQGSARVLCDDRQAKAEYCR